MPATKKSNVSVRLMGRSTSPYTITWPYSISHFVQDVLGQTWSWSEISNAQAINTLAEERDYGLYYKDSLICTDKDKNKLRRMGYLIRKNMEIMNQIKYKNV